MYRRLNPNRIFTAGCNAMTAKCRGAENAVLGWQAIAEQA
jgi:hypothetical protein